MLALQTELDRADLGLLRCIPGPDGDPTNVDSTTAPSHVQLGPSAMPFTIELGFDADEPTGTFEVVAGTDVDMHSESMFGVRQS